VQFVKYDGGVDMGKLQHAVRMLDNVVDLFDFPVEKVNKVCRRNRRVGLGVMGFGDMLYKMRVGYGTSAGREAGRFVMHFINHVAHRYSEYLAFEKGAFPACAAAKIKPPRRNAALTSIAPTGTIAMMFGVSGGVEPRFALCYSKGT
jgi:ribonucleoside-diphosphate reductase alpha chain